uniref:Uncharacterized protein n=1 Tax=Leersia perrieri TaxID=77586 RepID=A0A0D9VH02_9ORYZ
MDPHLFTAGRRRAELHGPSRRRCVRKTRAAPSSGSAGVPYGSATPDLMRRIRRRRARPEEHAREPTPEGKMTTTEDACAGGARAVAGAEAEDDDQRAKLMRTNADVPGMSMSACKSSGLLRSSAIENIRVTSRIVGRRDGLGSKHCTAAMISMNISLAVLTSGSGSRLSNKSFRDVFSLAMGRGERKSPG